MQRSFHVFTKIICSVSILALFSRCDIPTESPDFSLTTSAKAPLILDQTFVLLGPDDSGLTSLIDTTNASFDTLFSVDPTNNRLLINQDLDDFELGDLDDLISDVALDPISVGVSIGSLEEQAFEAETFGSEVGLFVLPEIDLGNAPVNPGVASYPIGTVLVPPTVDLISLNGVSVESVRLSSATTNVNQFHFTLTNGLASGSLTDGLGGAPEVVLEQDNGGTTQELARVRFDSSPGPGQQASAVMDVSGQLLRANAVYRLIISTTEGDTPLINNPNDVQIGTIVKPLEYEETGVSDVPTQDNIDASGDAITLGGDTEFTGIIAAGGSITIRIANDLPFDVTLTDLTVRNLEDVGTIVAPSTMLDLSGLAPGSSTTIAANSANDLVFDMTGVAISSSIEVDVVATSPGINTSAVIAADDGLFTTVIGSVTVDQLFFTPDAEVFTTDGLLAINVDDVSFESGQEFVQLESGTLLIEELANEMALDMDMLQFSMPGFRVAPYGPGDSLVIQFAGNNNNPQNLQFSQLSGATTVRDIPIDLTDVRIYPVDNEARYNVFAVSESGTATALDVTDQILASLAPQNLKVSTVQAILNPTTVDLTDDTNGDGRLEITSATEAEVMDLNSLSELNEYDTDNFQFNGTQFTFSIDTNLGADIVFYAAMMGTQNDGSVVFLKGEGDFAVPAGDTLASSFTMNGTAIAAENLIRFVIPGTPTLGQTVTQTIEINETNSNLDEFISSIPEEFRYVGKGLVRGMSGGLVQLQKPFDLTASIGAAIPLSFSGAFIADETVELDLSDLADLTDPTNDVVINEGSLTLEYTNGLPVGIDIELEVMNDAGTIVQTLPETPSAYKLQPATADNAGLATAATSGTLDITINEDQLRALSNGREARLIMQVNTDQDRPATMRADDTFQVRLLGKFDLTVKVQE